MKRLAGPTPRKPNTRSLGHSRRRASQGETEHPAFQEMMAAILVNGVKTAIVWMAWTDWPGSCGYRRLCWSIWLPRA